MANTVFCVKLKQEAKGLNKAPFPGELGQKILANVSKQAWDQWIAHQTMLINEYRLSMIDAKAREFLKKEMEQFFFGDGSNTPEGYTPKSED